MKSTKRLLEDFENKLTRVDQYCDKYSVAITQQLIYDSFESFMDTTSYDRYEAFKAKNLVSIYNSILNDDGNTCVL